MKSDSLSLLSPTPSLFQIAAFFEDLFPDGARRPHPALAHVPFADLMVNPEKLLKLFPLSKPEAAAVSEETAKKVPAIKRSGRPAAPKRNGSVPRKIAGLDVLRKVEFSFHSPAANSVKLAGDFTGWERHPVAMMSSADGVWFTVVPLPPGEYSYRFIVDGEWCDDPASPARTPNPFGGHNAVIRVT